jgi:hypothetical protein
MQVPPLQLVAPLAGGGHAWLHMPQLLVSVSVSTHELPHFVYVASHWKPHTPPEHVAEEFGVVSLQALLQPPQCWGSVCVLVHVLPHGSGVLPLQLVTHVPFWQSASEPPLHMALHAPQLLLVVRLVVQPVPLWEQSPQPGSHVYTQAPPVQARPVELTCGSAVQSLPQAAQSCTSAGTQPPSQACEPAPHPPVSPPDSTTAGESVVATSGALSTLLSGAPASTSCPSVIPAIAVQPATAAAKASPMPATSGARVQKVRAARSMPVL